MFKVANQCAIYKLEHPNQAQAPMNRAIPNIKKQVDPHDHEMTNLHVHVWTHIASFHTYICTILAMPSFVGIKSFQN